MEHSIWQTKDACTDGISKVWILWKGKYGAYLKTPNLLYIFMKSRSQGSGLDGGNLDRKDACTDGVSKSAA